MCMDILGRESLLSQDLPLTQGALLIERCRVVTVYIAVDERS